VWPYHRVMRQILLVILVGTAHADPVADAMHQYYEGELQGGGQFLGVGLGAVTVGGGLHGIDDPRGRNASYALFAVAAIEIVAGAALIAASPGRARKLNAELASQRRLAIDHELKHMNRVHKQFLVVEAVEVAIAIASVATLGVGLSRDDDTMIGVGAGLFSQGIAMLLLDLASHRRALRYRRVLAAAE
jgi:hypothetical protein